MIYSVSYPLRRVFLNQVEVVESLPPFVFSYSIEDIFYRGDPAYKELVLYLTTSGFLNGTHSFFVHVYHETTTSRFSQSITYRLITYRPKDTTFNISGSISGGEYPTIGVPPFFVFRRIGWKDNFYEAVQIDKTDFLPMSYDLLWQPLPDISYPVTLLSFSYYLSHDTFIENQRSFRPKSADPVGLNLSPWMQQRFGRLFRTVSGLINGTIVDQPHVSVFRSTGYGIDLSTLQNTNHWISYYGIRSVQNATAHTFLKNYAYFYSSASLETISFYNVFQTKKIFWFYSFSTGFDNEVLQSYFFNTLTQYSLYEIDFSSVFQKETYDLLNFISNELKYVVFQDFSIDKIVNFSGSLEYKTYQMERLKMIGRWIATKDSFYRALQTYRNVFLQNQNTTLSLKTTFDFQNNQSLKLNAYEVNYNCFAAQRDLFMPSFNLYAVESAAQPEYAEITLREKTGEVNSSAFPFNRRIYMFKRITTLSGRGTVLFEDPYFDVEIVLTAPEFIIY